MDACTPQQQTTNRERDGKTRVVCSNRVKPAPCGPEKTTTSDARCSWTRRWDNAAHAGHAHPDRYYWPPCNISTVHTRHLGDWVKGPRSPRLKGPSTLTSTGLQTCSPCTIPRGLLISAKQKSTSAGSYIVYCRSLSQAHHTPDSQDTSVDDNPPQPGAEYPELHHHHLQRPRTQGPSHPAVPSHPARLPTCLSESANILPVASSLGVAHPPSPTSTIQPQGHSLPRH